VQDSRVLYILFTEPTFACFHNLLIGIEWSDFIVVSKIAHKYNKNIAHKYSRGNILGKQR
jgi:hypothetical protein